MQKSSMLLMIVLALGFIVAVPGYADTVESSPDVQLERVEEELTYTPAEAEDLMPEELASALEYKTLQLCADSCPPNCFCVVDCFGNKQCRCF